LKAIVTVIGNDKIGIIYEVSKVCKESNVNIIDINQTLLQEYFTMIMLVDLELMNIEFKELKNRLEDTGKNIGLSIKIQHEDIFKTMHTI
jgi:ACT domain-containing protein